MNALTGTGKLIRLILRRDRIILPAWTVLIGILPLVYASGIQQVYTTEVGRQQFYASIAGNPSFTSMFGPVFGPSLGALTAWRSGILVLFIGLASAVTVIRHTRTEEEAGRRELLAATVVGRHAPLAAALVVTVAGNVLMGVVIVATLLGAGLPMVGTAALAASYVASGVLFAAAGAVAAQLTEGAGGARGFALGSLGAVFLLRAAGDAGGPDGAVAWLSWLSPIGWAHRVRPYAGEQWWMLAPILALAVTLFAVAAMLTARRDLGAGMFVARLGRAAGAPRFGSPVALAWRLHRRALTGWTIGFVVIGAVIGGAAQSIDALAEGTQLKDLLARIGGTAALKDAYISATLSLLTFAVAGYAIATTLRLRSEEIGLRAELVLATAVSRARWTASHLLFALVGPAVALAVLGTSISVASGTQLSNVVVAAMAYLPAIWVLAAVTVAGFGLLPRMAAAIAWGVLAVCLFVALLGPLLQLDQHILNVSPFTHVPKLPGGQVTATPLLWLMGIAAVFTAAGVIGFRRRDLDSTA